MKYFIVVISLSLLCACSSKEKDKTPSLPLVSSTTHTAKNISDFALYNQSYFIVSSETQGLKQLKDKHYTTLLKGSFGQITINKNTITVINTTDNQLEQLNYNNNKISKVASIKPYKIQIDGFCFYDSHLDHNRYVFLLNGDGSVEQFLYQEKDTSLEKPLFVRSFYVGPDVDTCLVDNTTGLVYFMEPAAGLWRYRAEPESVLERDLIHGVSPIGQLPKDLTSLAWLGHQQIGAVIKDSNQYVVIDLGKDKSKESINTLTVDDKKRELDKLKAAQGQILLFDSLNNQQLVIENTVQRKNIEQAKNKTQKDNKQIIASVTANIETKPVENSGDSADDPAIWRNHNTPRDSLILGTNKKKGLRVYNLKGELVQSIDNGRVNNVDLKYNLRFNDKNYDLAAASNRSYNSISLYLIDQNTGKVTLNQEVSTSLPNIYGLCMGKSNDLFSVWVNDKSGVYQEYVIANSQNGKLKAKFNREFKLPSQPEGCTVYQSKNQLFAGEEGAGIWLINLDDKILTPNKIVELQDGVLVDDIEGLDIAYAQKDEKDLLIASSQGDNSYVLIETIPPYKILHKFRVKINSANGIDGVSETDGLAVTTESLGRTFPNGILVVQDGFNLMPNEAQNFKVIAWDKISKQLR